MVYPFQEAADVAPDHEELPAVSRGQVFAACFQTSAVLVAFAFLLRARAAALSAALLHTDPAEVNRLLSCELPPAILLGLQFPFLLPWVDSFVSFLTLSSVAAVEFDFHASHVAVALGCAAAVSGARVLLLQRWPAFAEATDKSNQQVLQNLAPFDLLWVSFLPGISEELLFRGALIPSLYPDW